jgi:hypothetical protein
VNQEPGSGSDPSFQLRIQLEPTAHCSSGTGSNTRRGYGKERSEESEEKLKKEELALLEGESSVADPGPFDSDPAFQFDKNPDPTVLHGSGSLPFQRGNVPKTVLFIHLYLIYGSGFGSGSTTLGEKGDESERETLLTANQHQISQQFFRFFHVKLHGFACAEKLQYRIS